MSPNAENGLNPSKVGNKKVHERVGRKEKREESCQTIVLTIFKIMFEETKTPR